MTAASIPVDLFNPGQVFACLGFMEAALALMGDGVRGGFDWSDPTRSSCFRLCAPTRDQNPFAVVLEFLAGASVTTLAADTSKTNTEKWRVETAQLHPDAPFSIPEPSSPATLPAMMASGEAVLLIDHWGDGTRRDNVKFWAGSGGYPGGALLRDALDLVRGNLLEHAAAPFSLSARQSSSFRFDWRRDYIPIDAGFSPNEHGDVVTRGYPLVEILAAVGLAHARPRRETKLLYHYGVIGRASPDEPIDAALLPPSLVRAALGGTFTLPFAVRRFDMTLGWPGQENQARCITTVTEESRI